MLVFRDARREKLDLDLRLGQSVHLQRLSDRLHHAVGATYEGGIDFAHVHPMLQQRIGLLAVDPPVQDFDVLRLAAHDINEVETGEEAVLQVGKLLPEDHRARRAVAVEKREAAVGFREQRRLDDRQQGRDAAACREANIVLPVRGLERNVEVPQRRHHVDGRALPQVLVGPRGEHASGGLLDRDAQLVVLHRRADRIGAAHVLAADIRAQRQVLALHETKRLSQRRRHVECERDRVARFTRDRSDRQRMELAHLY